MVFFKVLKTKGFEVFFSFKEKKKKRREEGAFLSTQFQLLDQSETVSVEVQLSAGGAKAMGYF